MHVCTVSASIQLAILSLCILQAMQIHRCAREQRYFRSPNLPRQCTPAGNHAQGTALCFGLFQSPSILHPSIFLFLVLFNSTLLTLPTHAACSPHSSSPPSWPAHRTPSSIAIRARPSCECEPLASRRAKDARDRGTGGVWRRRAEFAWADASAFRSFHPSPTRIAVGVSVVGVVGIGASCMPAQEIPATSLRSPGGRRGMHRQAG